MTESASRTPRSRFPLYARVLLGVASGTAFGLIFGDRPYLFGWNNSDLGEIGLLVIRLLKALATPLVLFAILDSLARTRVSASRAGKLILIALINVSVAMTIGLTIMNTLHPGLQWQGKFIDIVGKVHGDKSVQEIVAQSHKGSLSLKKNLDVYIPKSLIDPLAQNEIIPVVLVALLMGAALRSVQEKQRKAGQTSIQVVERFIEAFYQILLQMLEWVTYAVPFAVFGILAQVVGKHGLGVFNVLWLFLVVILVGFALHALVYYPLMAWLVGGKSPRQYLGTGAEAIVTALSINSSLATVPVTVKCLKRMGVSDSSTRLAVFVGTNLNHDGITLYEAMAALFLAQASGFSLNLGQQVTVVLSSIMAGAGVAGIPEAGFVMLPLVLGAANLPETAIAQWLPIILTVDWILARCRSAVNVMNEMMVATVLDRGYLPENEETETLEPAI